MSDDLYIYNEMIPLLVSGQLPELEANKLLKAIDKSPILQAELSLWQGINSISDRIALYDFSDHPEAALLDLMAREKLGKFSHTYSQLSSHLEKCVNCREDLALLRGALKEVPETDPEPVAKTGGLVRSLFGLFASPKPVIVAALSLAAVLLLVVVFFPRADLTTIMLEPQFELRNQPATGTREYQVILPDNIKELALGFVTDRIDITDYHYTIMLNPPTGESVDLSSLPLECIQTQLTNRCEISIIDQATLEILKTGGSFTLSVTELFPPDIDFPPAEYRYFFNVLVED